MYKKFIIFIDSNLNPHIVLGNVNLHRNIEAPEGLDIVCRGGGGYWFILDDTLRLSEDSFDFGKYDFDHAEKAFAAGNVWLNGEKVTGLTQLITK